VAEGHLLFLIFPALSGGNKPAYMIMERGMMAKKLAFALCCFLLFPVLTQGQDCLPNGDVNCSGDLSPADVLLLINKVFNNQPLCDESRGDLNCDGFRDMADIVLLLNCYFRGIQPLGPCPILLVRPIIPDFKDSFIIESKTVFPGVGEPAARLQIWITNKDSLSAVIMPVREVSVSGGAYLVFDSLLRIDTTFNFPAANKATTNYDGSSPDSLLPFASGVGPGGVLASTFHPFPHLGNDVRYRQAQFWGL